jgi:large subunit ribosomal protein L31
MKPNTHPDYHPVVFHDGAADVSFLTRSTATSATTIEWTDGNTYPLVRVDISNQSHPFWTGTARIMDTEGQVEKFRKRYGTRPGRGAAV